MKESAKGRFFENPFLEESRKKKRIHPKQGDKGVEGSSKMDKREGGADPRGWITNMPNNINIKLKKVDKPRGWGLQKRIRFFKFFSI